MIPRIMISIRRPQFFWLLLIMCSVAFILPQPSRAQQEPGSKRRLLNHATPAYPALGRSMGLAGVVKVEAVVASDGSVKNVDIKGGHPVLAQAAVNAVRQWKWEPSAHESRELVEVKFSPE